MKRISLSFGKFLLFLVLLFIMQRLMFILFFTSELKGIELSQVLLTFVYGFPMDVATASSILLLVALLLLIKIFVQRLRMQAVVKYVLITAICLSWISTTADIALYESWGTRINSKALSYLAYPGEALKSTWSWRYLFLLSVMVFMVIISIRIFKNILRTDEFEMKRNARTVLFTCLAPAILVVLLRGGFQKYPLGKSWVYFSSIASLNQTALNGLWNFGYALSQPTEPEINPYKFFPDEEAKKIVQDLHASGNNSLLHILKSDHPNILMIVLESWGDSVTKREVNGKRITPQFEAMTNDGLLFTNFYSPGFRTEQGLAALVSGFPSQPTTSIVRKYGVFDKLPGLPKSLSNAGYASSFYYGGSLHFANTDGYLKVMGFEKLVGDENFPESKRTGWGIYDEELFKYFIADSKNISQPFFSIVMSCTSHEPFDG